jgi:pilus assembly protein CpaE
MKAPGLSSSRAFVSVFSEDAAARAALADQLGGLGTHGIRAAEIEAFFNAPRDTQRPAAIVLDLGTGGVLGDPRLGTARERWSGIPVLVVSDSMAPERARQVVRLRAVDWIQRPYAAKDLLGALSHAIGSTQADASRVVTFAGASGGAGATTLALMAAQFLAAKGDAGQTCLVDLDFQQASAGSYLNLINEFDLSGVISQPGRLDAEILEAIRFAPPGKPALYSFERPDLTFAETGRDFVLRLLDLAAATHRQTIIDLPRVETPWYADVLAGSDVVFVVFQLNVPSLRQARHVLERAREARGSNQNIFPVANKASFKLIGNPISRKDVTKIFTSGQLFAVASDEDVTTDALNRGLLPGEVSRRSRMVREAEAIFNTVLAK